MHLDMISYSKALEKAERKALKGEELKTINFNRTDTEGFEKAVAVIKLWSEMIQREMVKGKNFRIEINYNAEERKTDFAIYTAKEGGE